MSYAFSAAVRPLAAATVGVWLATTPTAAQEVLADAGSSDDWMPAQTSWGDPDLQGIWSSKTQTPLERPDEYAGKEFLTEEEVAALERQTVERRDERAERGTVADVAGAYNIAFSTFFATKVVETGRTSLIVDPPDGKIPYHPKARKRVDDEVARRRATREDADGPEDRPADRCLGFTLPCTSPLCAFSRIVQTPEAVTLYYEAGHWGGAYRTILLDGRPHLPPHVRQWFGDSRGRWEDDTLVNVGDPPALPGRPSVFDVSGSNVRNSPREPLKHHAGESSMNNYRSLNHTKWECQYHVVFIPKYRRKTLYGGLRHYLGDVLRRLAEQRESRVEEGHLLADHVHMLVSIPPKYSVAQVIGYIKGKSAIHIAREFAGRPRNFVGQHFWARGYYVSTVGQDERVVREYVQQQEREDRRLEQLRLEE